MSIKAALEGDPLDLGILADLFPAPGDPAVEAKGDGFYLPSMSLDDTLMSDGGTMLRSASDLLRKVNGAARIKDNSFRPVELVGTFTDSFGRQHAVVAVDSAEARAHASVVAVVTNGPPAPPPEAPQFVELASKQSDADDALRILGKPGALDWFDLYKLYEIVRDSVDASSSARSKGAQANLMATGWISKDDLRAFTGSANHQGASGDGARHARNEGPAPRRVLTLPEGRSLILSLVGSWLHSEVVLFRPHASEPVDQPVEL